MSLPLELRRTESKPFPTSKTTPCRFAITIASRRPLLLRGNIHRTGRQAVVIRGAPEAVKKLNGRDALLRVRDGKPQDGRGAPRPYRIRFMRQGVVLKNRANRESMNRYREFELASKIKTTPAPSAPLF